MGDGGFVAADGVWLATTVGANECATVGTAEWVTVGGSEWATVGSEDGVRVGEFDDDSEGLWLDCTDGAEDAWTLGLFECDTDGADECASVGASEGGNGVGGGDIGDGVVSGTAVALPSSPKIGAVVAPAEADADGDIVGNALCDCCDGASESESPCTSCAPSMNVNIMHHLAHGLHRCFDMHRRCLLLCSDLHRSSGSAAVIASSSLSSFLLRRLILFAFVWYSMIY
mmetsp:Transcript_2717/g.7530  ORF Transcript_2717/g.7530 Transcript_2717/m.7530 type:complete len:228 (-) Transcript_2717:557-1240(-)